MASASDTYTLAGEPQTIADRLVRELVELEHIQGARVAFVFSELALTLRGAPAAAFVGRPTIQGPLRDFFAWSLGRLTDVLFDGDDAEFLVMVDRRHYHGLGPEARERLVYHELKHIQHATKADGSPLYHQDGRPMLKTVPHDTEVFHDEVRRYGIATCNLEVHAQALADGERARKRRRAS